MIDKICYFILEKIKKEMPEIDKEREEVIFYGLQLIIGETPKIILTFIISFLFGVFKLTLLSYILLLPYKYFVGGVHAKTHLACMVTTPLIYCGNSFVSKILPIFDIRIRAIVILAIWIFSLIVINLYAPADTENVPILRKKERLFKKIMSYIIMTITLGIALIIGEKLPVISNILMLGVLIDSVFITRPMYKFYHNQYGHEIYTD